MRTLPFNIDSDRLRALCCAYGVVELSLFGSVLREDFRGDSDVDVLVKFEEGRTLTLESYMELGEALSGLFGGRAVDLVEEGRLVDPYRRFEILRTSERVYGE